MRSALAPLSPFLKNSLLLLPDVAGLQMALSDAGITAILKGAAEEGEPSVGVPCAVATQRMLKGLEDIEFHPGPASALVKLCDAGARYGWREWEATAAPGADSG